VPASVDSNRHHSVERCCATVGFITASMIAIPIGKRWRALQYEPVPMLFALNPSASRRAAQPFTTFWVLRGTNGWRNVYLHRSCYMSWERQG
jgi:predicted LPLAT superfamily acyltransferase